MPNFVPPHGCGFPAEERASHQLVWASGVADVAEHLGCLDTFLKRNGQWYEIGSACAPPRLCHKQNGMRRRRKFWQSRIASCTDAVLTLSGLTGSQEVQGLRLPSASPTYPRATLFNAATWWSNYGSVPKIAVLTRIISRHVPPRRIRRQSRRRSGESVLALSEAALMEPKASARNAGLRVHKVPLQKTPAVGPTTPEVPIQCSSGAASFRFGI